MNKTQTAEENDKLREPTGQRKNSLLAAHIEHKPLTLLPPTARCVCNLWPVLYGPLARISVLRSHYMSVVT
jgi:hypothetical protein